MSLNEDASETLVVGDMPVDILMGKGAGCTTCGVTYGNATREELVEAFACRLHLIYFLFSHAAASSPRPRQSERGTG